MEEKDIKLTEMSDDQIVETLKRITKLETENTFSIEME